MAEKSFRIDPFGTTLHNEKTRDIFSRVGSWANSKFARQTILRYAQNLGYPPNSYIDKPKFLNEDQWIIYRYHNLKSKVVDYNFYIAFCWLKSLPRFELVKDGALLRHIIESGEDDIIDFLQSLEIEVAS